MKLSLPLLINLCSIAILGLSQIVSAAMECEQFYSVDPTEVTKTIRPASDDPKRVQSNSFNVRRSFGEYNKFFKAYISRKLKFLEIAGKGHWVDMGAGEGIAQVQYLNRHMDGKVLLTSVGYALPDQECMGAKARIEFPKRYRYLEGWFDTQMAKKIGKTDLITDMQGIYTYTKHEERFALLDIYASMLNVGGFALIDADIKGPGYNIFATRHLNLKIEIVGAKFGFSGFTVIKKISE